jgi:Peptidase family M1 domain
MSRWFVLSVSALLACAPAARQPAPVPTPGPIAATTPPAAEIRGVSPAPGQSASVTPPDAFLGAVVAGTRTASGEPGLRYWQNWADYRIESRVFPEAQRVEGTSSIRYHNRSPDPLEVLVVDLTQNFHSPGAMRLEPVEVTGGVVLERVAVAGRVIGSGASGSDRYVVEGTKLVIFPAQPVGPGQTVELGIDWSFVVPQAGAGGRMGHSRDNLLFLAYWYPQMAAYDDVVGWHPDQFLGTAEFYSDFGNYQVTIEAPAGWLVMGTGALTNPDEVLTPQIASRLRTAERSDTVVHLVTPADLSRVTRESSGTLRWSFQADSVRDVAYSVTRESLWDAARTPVGDRDGDGATDYARVDAIYRQTAPLWTEVAGYAQHAVRFLSSFTGIAYPWTHMSVVEGGGIIGGGMEYPMMTLIGEYTAAGPDALYNVTAHEIAHMWVPMIVNTDERRYAWMDEGTTNFNENQARKNLTPQASPEMGDRTSYLDVAEAGQEGEIMRRSDYHYPGAAYVVATYYKPSTLLTTLRGVLGEEVFLRAYREYLRRWRFKHPYPWDMWNTFESVAGRDLDWFWRSWYYGTGILDQAVESVTTQGGSTEIVVRSLGENPMPTRLTVRLENGATVEPVIPVENWLGGVQSNAVTVPGTAVRVEIDAANLFPDADRENNVWSR